MLVNLANMYYPMNCQLENYEIEAVFFCLFLLKFQGYFWHIDKRPFYLTSKIINTEITTNYNTFLGLFAFYFCYHKLNIILPTFILLTLCHLKHISKCKYSFLPWKSCTINTTILTFSVFYILTGCLFQS